LSSIFVSEIMTSFESEILHNLLVNCPSQGRHESSAKHPGSESDEETSRSGSGQDHLDRAGNVGVSGRLDLHLCLDDIGRMGGQAGHESGRDAAGEVGECSAAEGQAGGLIAARNDVVFQLCVEHQVEPGVGRVPYQGGQQSAGQTANTLCPVNVNQGGRHSGVSELTRLESGFEDGDWDHDGSREAAGAHAQPYRLKWVGLLLT